jgi:hypothetical protein
MGERRLDGLGEERIDVALVQRRCRRRGDEKLGPLIQALMVRPLGVATKTQTMREFPLPQASG